jgi:hypothetical protein
MSLIDEKDNASLERGAENDVVRPRWRLKIRENIIARLVAENQRLRLADEERVAVLAAADLLIACKHVATLRWLLWRTK